MRSRARCGTSLIRGKWGGLLINTTPKYGHRLQVATPNYQLRPKGPPSESREVAIEDQKGGHLNPNEPPSEPKWAAIWTQMSRHLNPNEPPSEPKWAAIWTQMSRHLNPNERSPSLWDKRRHHQGPAGSPSKTRGAVSRNQARHHRRPQGLPFCGQMGRHLRPEGSPSETRRTVIWTQRSHHLSTNGSSSEAKVPSETRGRSTIWDWRGCRLGLEVLPSRVRGALISDHHLRPESPSSKARGTAI